MTISRKGISRRDFFFFGIADVAREAHDSLAKRVAPSLHIRPPGALAELPFLGVCRRCGACVNACSYDLIHLLPARAGAAIGTPAMSLRQEYCRMCEDAPCTKACSSGALISVDGLPAHIGTAVVDPARCWSALGQECDYCARECRRHRKAVRVSMGSPPCIDDSLCDGCGRCEYICPVTGEAAVKVVPRNHGE